MKKKCISASWLFSSEDYQGKQTVDLPHDYVIRLPRDPEADRGANTGFFTGREASYVKYMRFDNSEHTILDIDGAYMCARIFCNDDLIDMHPYGYTPYLVDLTEYIEKGRTNKLGISVTNVQPSTRWYSGSGVYRDVFVWTGGKVRIEPWDLFVHTQSVCEGCAEINVKMSVSADMECTADMTVSVLDAEEKLVRTEKLGYELLKGKNFKELTLNIENPMLWSCDTPKLYTLKVDIWVDGKLEDEYSTDFGVRTVTADAQNGLLLNGKPLKLKGGCIHHDHAVLGSAELPAAISRKLQLLKSVGYNAVRIAHNPPSLALLEVCDRIGMLVMDEAFDMWNQPKNRMDYSLWFRDWWQRDISYMVLRDRNHPSVISYSIGNEIDERNGNSKGYEWAQKLADEIRKYDATRLVTAGVCGMWNRCDENAPDDYKEIYKYGLSDIGTGEIDTSWGDRTENYMKPLDIVGYNYLYYRYEHDRKKYPNRVIWGSETHAITFFESWQATVENPNVIGDFTWTAFDNLGEAGTGRYAWSSDEYINGISLADYPWRSCYQGDFDLCGYRRPQSYFREAIWKNETSPHIFTTHPRHNGDAFSGTGWHWYDVEESWTFGDEYIGEPVKTEVYTTADEVKFYLNGAEIGSAKPIKGIASLDIPYEKGELRAVAIRGGKAESEFSVSTHNSAYRIRVVSERDELCADNRDLCYFNIFVEDKDNRPVSNADFEITCEVFGGELMGILSGNPHNEDQYGTDKCHIYQGRALAIVRCKAPGSPVVRVYSDGLKDGVSNIVKAI